VSGIFFSNLFKKKHEVLMNKRIIDFLVCPIHKSTLIQKGMQRTLDGVIKYGSLYCCECNKIVASIKYGKVDFLRIDHNSSSKNMGCCDSFYYKRVPWSDVKSTNCTQVDLGWNSEGFSGCLMADSSADWEIRIDTNATDLSLRFLSHAWSGCVNVTINETPISLIDLYSTNENVVKPFEIYRNLAEHKRIVIKPGAKNLKSKDSQVYFFGMDAIFPGEIKVTYGNRGNGFPSAYNWILNNLGSDSIVMDCSSGDRKHSDERVISFEYMPFEYPDIFGDGHALPFADGTFDAVFSQAVMEHMRDPYLAAREISRVTKPDGIIYVESAFMQPLHAVPYHFFNTTTWGIEAIFNEAKVSTEISEWFGPISFSVDWYLNACGGGGLSIDERDQLRKLFLKVDKNVTYEQLKPIASGVSFWGIKEGGKSYWTDIIRSNDRPTFKYLNETKDSNHELTFKSASSVGSRPLILSKVKKILNKIIKIIRKEHVI
jgi:SAM-dependent methyltransferase